MPGNDIEKEVLQELEHYSIQARANAAPWDSASAPGVGPGLFENMLSVSMLSAIGGAGLEFTPWSYYPMQRDRQLSRLWKSEGIMAGAIYSMSARIGALPANVTGKPRAKSRAQELVHNLDVQRLVVDLLTTDNGFFIERVGPGRPDRPLNKNLIKQLSAMDSKQCWRTFDPEFPVIYVNPYTGAYHKMHYTRVISDASCRQPEELARGIGFCAVSRALMYVQVMRDIATYKHEKVGGRFKRAIGIMKGFTPKTVKETLESHELNQDSLGFTRYQQIPWLITQNQEAGAELIDLASLPDGFDTMTDTDIYVYSLALAFGTDAREFWPATSGGATKADATVQHEKSRGKGIGDIIQTLERALNWGAMPDGCEVEYDYTDDAEQMAEATYHNQVILNVGLLQTQGNITPDQGNKILISKGVLDPDVINNDDDSIPATDQMPYDIDQQQIAAALASGVQLPGVMPKPGFGSNPGKQPNMNTEDVKPAEKAVKKKLTPAQLLALNQTYRDDLETMMQDFIDSGETDPDDLGDDFKDILIKALTTAFGVGLAGLDATKDAIAALNAIAVSAMGYFRGLVSDLRSAMSADELSPDEFVNRAGLYAGDQWQALWVGVGDRVKQSGSLRVRRVLDLEAQHCETCPPKARIYNSFEEMEAEAGIPGDGSDDCLSNCRCSIEIETAPGSGVFTPDIFGAPTVYTEPIIDRAGL